MEFEAAKVLAAGICMGMGSFGPAVAEGYVAGKVMEATGRNPEVGNKLFTNMLVAMAVCESTGIYSLVIAFLILFAV